MATASELLAMAADSGIDKTLIIDTDSRTIAIPKPITTLGVEADDDVHRLYFCMPRYYGDTDLSELNIRINYMNARTQRATYVVTDKKVLNSTITFSWLVGPNALAYKGNVNFIVCAQKADTTGKIINAFHTTVTTLPVLEGLEVDTAMVEDKVYDIFEHLLALTEAKMAEVESAGASEIEKVVAKSTEEQENVVNKGAEVLATIPEDYQTTTKLANEGVRTKADAIVCSAEGETISIHDSSDDNLRGLNIYGKSTQITTTGKNLLDVEEYLEFTHIYGKKLSIPAGTYILTFAGETHGGAYAPYVCFKDNDVGALVATPGKQYPIVLTNDETQLYIYANNYDAAGSEGISATINQLMLSVDGGDYEPYTGGVPAPNPDYPQEIVSVENPSIDVCGGNLFDFYGIPETDNIARNQDGSLTVTLYSATTSKFLWELAPSLSVGNRYTFAIDTDSSSNFIYLLESKVTWWHGLTITMTDEILNSRVYVYGVNGDAPIIIRNMAIVPEEAIYNGETYITPQTIDIARTLPGIPVTSGGNYTDSDGQQWICDEIDFERGVYVQRIVSATFDGTENWQSINNELCLHIDETSTTDGDNPQCYCSRYPSKSRFDVYNHKDESGYIGCGVRENYVRIVDNAVCNGNVDAFTSLLSDWNVNGEPMIIAYILATPIETALTAEEIEAFKELKTNYPNTTVLNDSGAMMKLKYNADTETWIKNLIDERIAAAIANIQ